ncbi:hypothetical protein KEJ27_04210 [Candidatus Bathyarchaeota archaeon]|nr:hypothetical protein [Candidatus Bathyarchaeota archaeon]MBS7613197.1 hypothetical protein [Candidatus Bathyarchaeota archaeon]
MKVSEELLREFTRTAKSLGLTRSEALRKAMELFIASSSGGTVTSRMRGLVKSKLSLRELEEAYMVSKL